MLSMSCTVCAQAAEVHSALSMLRCSVVREDGSVIAEGRWQSLRMTPLVLPGAVNTELELCLSLQ